MDARQLRRMSLEEYLALEQEGGERWEYVSGEAFAMAGASPRHNAIAMNLAVVLGGKLRGKGCFALGSDQRVETSATRSYHYPDTIVVCGKPRYSEKDPHALTNPSVLIEVLSGATADYDRGLKFDHYKTITGLNEYLAIFSDKRRVQHMKRVGPDQWLVTDLIGGEVPLESAGITLSLDEIYADLERVEP